MIKHIIKAIGILVLCSSCNKIQYSDYPEHLFGEIEKTWHLDSVSINGSRDSRKATLSCVSDDKYVFRYDNTLTYFNNQTEYICMADGWACGDTNIFAIQPWNLLQDTLLEIEGTVYEIDLLEMDEMVLRIKNEQRESGYDYSFYYPRD